MHVLPRHNDLSGSTTDTALTLGVFGFSLKTDEWRVPIHPAHLDRIPADLRGRVLIEEGYGEHFGIPDSELAPHVGRICSRAELFERADILALPKPQHEDIRAMREGQILWGWPHCVQDRTLTQLAIDKHLTLIAFEAMHYWGGDGSFNLHVFHANNELAGYSSVLHSLQLLGSTGNYGRRLTATVIGFGATARGAITALGAHGITQIRVLTNRAVTAVAAPIHSVDIVQFAHEDEPYQSEAITDEGRVPLAPFLAESDVVVNCTLQDPNAPLLYLHDDDLQQFTPGSLIVDVSCDEGMGFSWARPTSFAEPMLTLANGISYYAVDHSPSYLWNSASWENSAALLPFLETVMAGPAAWADVETIDRAIEIQDGEIRNPDILEFQGREAEYPHRG
ncbi:N(5)-(carboxyethyl)ornithine synthase [Brachybacterium fresconis]|uniref:Alanine dehydrogenase n=1 Tax=Brachybacterium fresconis TaxID=173363 RepID=A0ABS4YMU0_9MICO|nr:N(5)-(carboxyethyl)ornithine synthase [Brachybacterium fresconis]MBP2410117.1 alanine dehydrogenase [Brachybacterium fresconis]